MRRTHGQRHGWGSEADRQVYVGDEHELERDGKGHTSLMTTGGYLYVCVELQAGREDTVVDPGKITRM